MAVSNMGSSSSSSSSSSAGKKMRTSQAFHALIPMGAQIDNRVSMEMASTAESTNEPVVAQANVALPLKGSAKKAKAKKSPTTKDSASKAKKTPEAEAPPDDSVLEGEASSEEQKPWIVQEEEGSLRVPR
jgi:hypothetical protein